ncbi:HipA domain-containing protein [Tenacibaculum finnmarkense]|uniref:HipA domain-containing protein n=1 Tax=Tenacibaculum finnmarkense TaxID=2781243 RepID=UPI001EFB355E
MFSNGDAHFKNFSLIETPLGDFKLSPAYDLLNSRIHIDDNDFALEDGLLPPNLAQGKITTQFYILGEKAGIPQKQIEKVFNNLTSKKKGVLSLIDASFLSEKLKRNYTQAYQTRLKKLLRL